MSSSSVSEETTTMEGLLSLVRAVRFAFPEYGAHEVHREIVEVASVKHNEPALRDVTLETVTNLYNSLERQSSFNSRNGTTEEEEENTAVAPAAAAAVDGGEEGGDADAKKDESSPTAAENVTTAEAKDGAPSNNEGANAWFRFPLDSPADPSGDRPYQTLMSYNNEEDGKNRPQHKDHKIVKIQVAAAPPGVDIETPMLLYDAERKIRTFILPNANGYKEVRTLITNLGTAGVLGATGGTKGYFRCRVTKDGTAVEVDASSLAEPQLW